MKTILILVILIAGAGYLVYNYVLESEDCPRRPDGACIGTTTGYEQTPGIGGGEPIELQLP